MPMPVCGCESAGLLSHVTCTTLTPTPAQTGILPLTSREQRSVRQFSHVQLVLVIPSTLR
eukprot:NODE_2772_length_645_cov_3.533557_g2299_i0.p5 GENE.NODE_2772_length_645_cov_3.533557_g2299_i0~~NODE_2772_length_645_cov_3.533557_g2299_i0.p5  ORF type:complete len:60 (-),score=10.55 NODE_2772_length_645_cov_3.533557_g2299_i0:3-182(-)